MSLKVLVTGGAGFIGSNFIHYALEYHFDWQITNLDKLTYAGNLENLADVEVHGRYRLVKGDIASRESVHRLLSEGFDVVVNFAAESHVDRSILDASPFIETNVTGTQVLLEGARVHKVGRFIQVSTDEVYGSLGPKGRSDESSTIQPNSPYAASKAAADCLCRAYGQTYGLPVIVTRCCNNYGPYQFPEKLIPLVVTNALEGKPIPVYGDGLNVRQWIYVTDHCQALDTVIEKGKPGEIYNVAADNEKTNLELVRAILKIMGKPESLISFVTDRPGHDRRYALDASKIARELGWKHGHAFEATLKQTVEWYQQHRSWWQKIKSGEYARYYDTMYSSR